MASVCVKTFGCAANQAEGEMMKGILAGQYDVTDDDAASDALVLNVCTVKGEVCAMRSIKAARAANPRARAVIAGCITPALIELARKTIPDASFISTHNLSQIADAVGEALADSPVELTGRARPLKLQLPRIRRNHAVGILPIESGCDSACTFCSTKLIKGALQSYPEDALVDEVRAMVTDGCKEIWITGQDTGAYGRDIGSSLPRLLRRIIAVEGDFRIRLGMANPRHVIKYVDELAEIYKSPKMFAFLHIPVQSGSTAVLERMKRMHTSQEYKSIIAALRAAHPRMSFWTDIIVGFPGETEEQFFESMALIRDTAPDVVNISRFASRPGTIASRMPGHVPGPALKARSNALAAAVQDVGRRNNLHWLGWEGDIIIDEQVRPGSWQGRNFAYRPVVVRGEFRLGQRLRVRVTETTKQDLRAEVLDEQEAPAAPARIALPLL